MVVHHRLYTSQPEKDFMASLDHPDLREPLLNAEKEAPRLIELIMMSDSILRAELAAGLDSSDLKAVEPTYTKLLAELNALGHYGYFDT